MIVPVERLTLHCFQLEAQYYLLGGPEAVVLAAAGQAAFTPVYLRYAFSRFGTGQPFFPGLAVDDRGKFYRGLEAVDWLANYRRLYPRADVEGVWFSGEQEQIFVKELDLGLPTLVYASAGESDFPGHLVTAAIELVTHSTLAVAPGGNYAARIGLAIPVFQLNAAVPLSKALQLIPLAAVDLHPIELDSLDK